MLKNIQKLCEISNPYKITKESDGLFVKAMRENVVWHADNNAFYKRLLKIKDFTADQLQTIDDVGKVPNLMVARTFSKAYGLANLRIGMLAGCAELMKYVRKVSSPYNVNGVALDCLPVALADEAYVAWYVGQVRVGLGKMMDGLRALGVDFFPSHANFVLMKIGPKHADLVKALTFEFPTRIISELLGLPREDLDMFRRLSLGLISIQTDIEAGLIAANE